MEGAQIMLISAITFLIFVISVSIVGVLMYRLGLNGRITRMMEDAEDARKAKGEEKKDAEPTVIPGNEHNPYQYGHTPRYDWASSGYEDEDEEEPDGFVTKDEIAEAELEEEPVVPGKKKAKVVMTGGGLFGAEQDG